MSIRRILFVAALLVLAWVGPASADHAYDHILPTTLVRPTVPPGVTPTTLVRVDTPPDVAATSAGPGNLARTGGNNFVPLIQAAIVLIGGGTLLVLVARRRHNARRATA